MSFFGKFFFILLSWMSWTYPELRYAYSGLSMLHSCRVLLGVGRGSMVFLCAAPNCATLIWGYLCRWLHIHIFVKNRCKNRYFFSFFTKKFFIPKNNYLCKIHKGTQRFLFSIQSPARDDILLTAGFNLRLLCTFRKFLKLPFELFFMVKICPYSNTPRYYG